MEKTLTRLTKNSVTTAANGQDAMQALKEKAFELVITDIIMPDIEGFELINHISSHYPETHIIAISGGGRTSSPQYLEVASKIGAEKMIGKPFSGDELLSCVGDILGKDSIGK